MALVYATGRFDIGNWNLGWVSALPIQMNTEASETAFRIEPVTLDGILYPIRGSRNFLFAESVEQFRGSIAGDGLTLDLTGTATVYAQGNGPSDLVIEGFSLALSKFVLASTTANVADDMALLAKILSGDDAMRLSAFDDIVAAFDGNDVVEGGDGSDRIAGNDGNDRLFGGAGNDDLSGGNGNDGLFGFDDRDTLTGGAGTDTLDAGAGNDRLVGGRGADLLTAVRRAMSSCSLWPAI